MSKEYLLVYNNASGSQNMEHFLDHRDLKQVWSGYFFQRQESPLRPARRQSRNQSFANHFHGVRTIQNKALGSQSLTPTKCIN